MKEFDLGKPGAADEIASVLNMRTEDFMRMAAVEFFRQVTISTPVDTGRARMGWMISVNAPSTYRPPEAPKGTGFSSGGVGYYAMPNIAENMNIGTITVSDVIYITNNVPYIGRLNDGYSRQAAARFVERAAARVQLAVAKLWKKTKG